MDAAFWGGKWCIMAVLAAANPEPATISDRTQPDESGANSGQQLY
jgi:hypothetical protein